VILSAEVIRQRMRDPIPNKLIVSPLLDAPGQLGTGSSSIDLRLGQEFMLADPAVLGYLDPLDEKQAENELAGYLRALHVSVGGALVLHPKQFALGATLEYLRMPLDLTAHVIGRSRWARVGLIIAMATYVHPGYSGCLTLEMQNLGDAPIELSPGYPVAQLVVEEVIASDEPDPTQLACAIGPEFWPLLSDTERAKLSALRSKRSRLTHDGRW